LATLLFGVGLTALSMSYAQGGGNADPLARETRIALSILLLGLLMMVTRAPVSQIIGFMSIEETV